MCFILRSETASVGMILSIHVSFLVCRVHARFSLRSAGNASLGMRTGERLIRYIDGTERLIRYPNPAQQRPTPSLPPYNDDVADTDSWRICGEHDVGCSVAPSADFDVSLPGCAPIDALWGEAPESQPAPAEHASAAGHDAHNTGLAALPLEDTVPSSSATAGSELPDSPAELLRLLQSDQFKQQRHELQAQLVESYTVLSECPWPVPRQLTLLAVQQRDHDNPTMYTLPVAMPLVRAYCAGCMTAPHLGAHVDA